MRTRALAVLATLTTATNILAAGTAANGAAMDEPVSLKPNLTPGYEARVVMEMTRKTTERLGMNPGGGAPPERTLSGTQTVGFLMKVVRSDDAGAVVTMRIDDIETTATTPRGEFRWKSTDPRTPGDNNNLALTSSRPMLGATITFTLDKDGNVVSADNGGVNMPTGDLSDYARLVVGNEEARARWSPVFAPRKRDFSVKIGDEWSLVEAMKNPPIGQFNTNMNLKVATASKNTARVEVNGNYSLVAFPEGSTLLFEVKGSKVAGQIEWDRTVGLFKSAEFDLEIELHGAAQGLPIQRKTETKIKIRREPAPTPKGE
jgi:hypothetical protein